MVETIFQLFLRLQFTPDSISFCWNLKKKIRSEILWNKWVYVLMIKVKKSVGELELTERSCLL